LRIAIPSLVFDIARQVQEVGGLADQVERHIREAEVDLDRWGMTAPFGQALSEDEAVVAEPDQEIEMNIAPRVERRRIELARACSAAGQVDRGQRRHQMCFTSSGIW
jgi:hypothetical protein